MKCEQLRLFLVGGMESQTYTYALKLLAIKDYSEHCLRFKLANKNFPEGEIEEVIKKLKDFNYIDDLRYAKARIYGLANKNNSVEEMRLKLLKDKIRLSRDQIEAILGEKGLSAHSIHQKIMQKYKRQKPQRPDESPEDFQRRLKQKMAQKGVDFGDWEQISTP